MEERQDSTMTVDSPPKETTEPVHNEPKRKRGKKKVMKRTTKRDDKGYLGIFSV
jgi:hypothetical protein